MFFFFVSFFPLLHSLPFLPSFANQQKSIPFLPFKKMSSHGKPTFSLAQYPDLPANYRLEQLLGEGAFSSVYRAEDVSTGEKVAVKIINKENLSAKQLGNIQNEINIMNTLSNVGGHPNILHLIEYFDTPDNCFLVLEICDGGEIFNKIIEYTYFSEPLAKHVFLQLLEAISFLHRNNIVHRDIKPENLLFKRIPYVPRPADEYKAALRKSDDSTKKDEGRFLPGVGGGGIGTIKLADFGLAKQLKYDPLASTQSNLKTPCGTAGYTAPEVIHCGVAKKRRFKTSALKSNYYSKAVDIWSLGCFLYTVLCGFPPFYDDDQDVLTHKILTADFVFLEPWWDEISADAKDLISRMLVVNPIKRITLDEIYSHPWMADAVPLASESYFPEMQHVNASVEMVENVQTDRATDKPTDSSVSSLDALSQSISELSVSGAPGHATSPFGSKNGLASPSLAIKKVFSNPAMSHVNLKLLAHFSRAVENVDPMEVKFDPKTSFAPSHKSHLPRTPMNVNFRKVFSEMDREDDEDDSEDSEDSDEDEDDEDESDLYGLESVASDEELASAKEVHDKLMGLKYLSISSLSSTNSLKLINEDDGRTRSSSVISGINGDYKFCLNMNDLNLLRRRSSVKSGHA